jgi:hypothetical protein
MTRTPISAGADRRLRRACDGVARLIAAGGGRVLAGLIDDMMLRIMRGAKPDAAARSTLLIWADVDGETLRQTGADRWPPRPFYLVSSTGGVPRPMPAPRPETRSFRGRAA